MVRCQELEEKILESLFEFFSAEPFGFEAMLMEKDSSKRDSLDIMNDLELIELFQNKNVLEMIDDFWSTSYHIEGTLWQRSLNYRLAYNLPNPMERPSKQQHFDFQFNVWKESLKVRFFVESIFLFIVTGVLMY